MPRLGAGLFPVIFAPKMLHMDFAAVAEYLVKPCYDPGFLLRPSVKTALFPSLEAEKADYKACIVSLN